MANSNWSGPVRSTAGFRSTYAGTENYYLAEDANGLHLGAGTVVGTTVALSVDSSGNLSFFGGTPVAQRSAYTQTYATADKTHAAPTAAALTVTDGAGTNDGTIGAIGAGAVDTAAALQADVIAAVQELADQINKLVADQLDTKQLVNSVIDDLQALGLVG